MLIIRTFLIFIFAFFWLTGSSQIKGVVLGQKAVKLENAYVLNTSSGDHSHTGSDGEFYLNQGNPGDTLKISFLGYSIATKIVDDKNLVKIEMTRSPFALSQVSVRPEMDAINLLTDIGLKTNPVNNSQEILRRVPGLFIGQHAGGGKAEQIFLRGFDIDHGTDLDITVDGMPVNMVSHAHGQGYSDLHFIIPELIDGIDFGKGPYYAQRGNFSTAGYVGFKSKNRLDENLVKIEAGQFNTRRYVGLIQVLDTAGQSLYLGTEYSLTDGPFESPQNFSRLNLTAKYQNQLDNGNVFSASVSHFTSRWDASGQIPVRAVDSGMISRFGAIDDTEGGETSRTNLIMNFTNIIDDRTYLKNTVYLSDYDFELFSNFTFFLEDSVNGDQIKQQEDRFLYGASSTLNLDRNLGNNDLDIAIGIGFRGDQVDNNGLFNTLNRETVLDTVQLGEVRENNSFAFASADLTLGKLTINPGLRVDHFSFAYNDALAQEYETQKVEKATVSPKLNFLYNTSDKLQLYLKTGKSFHSNDARVIIERTTDDILPAAYGADLGFLWKPFENTFINTALWYLYLEQEFVYVGDAGIVEPSGKTERRGIDFNIRHQPLSWMYLDADLTYTFARSINSEDGANLIPLAPEITFTTGVQVTHPSGLYGGVHLRYLADRPANEDNSIVATGYEVVDLNIGYQWKRINIGLQIQNLLDTDWNETQFATESRLRDEQESVEEIHFTPGTPFFLKTSLSYSF